MAKANKSGMINLYMRAIGRTIKPMVRAGLYMRMAMLMKVTGKMIKLMGMARTIIKMVPVIQANGLMISIMVTGLKNGPMALFIMVTTNTVKNMGMENLFGLMDLRFKEIFSMI